MNHLLALDFDGTLVESFTATPLPGAVNALRQVDSDLQIAVLTNQGGPAYRIAGSSKHPSPGEVARNLDEGLRAVGLTPRRLACLVVATHPGARWPGSSAEAQRAASMAAMELERLLTAQGWQARASASPTWRKPAPGGLLFLATETLTSLHNVTYVGDMASDAEAAQAAAAGFQRAQEWWRQ